MKKVNVNLDLQGSPDRFGYEWTYFHELRPEYMEQFGRWISVLERKNLDGLYVIDAGCGNGRNSLGMHKWGARRVLSFDVQTSTVEVAKKNLQDYGTILVKQMSIYDPKLPDAELADIAFSIGVIHHLADPVKALQSMCSLVKPGGLVCIWVYGKEGNEWLLWFLEPVRKITKHISMPILNLFSNFLAVPLYLALKFPFPKSKYLELISKFSYRHIRSIVLDQLLPKIANYWKKEEVHDLLEVAGLTNIQVKSVNDMSWSACGEVGVIL